MCRTATPVPLQLWDCNGTRVDHRLRLSAILRRSQPVEFAEPSMKKALTETTQAYGEQLVSMTGALAPSPDVMKPRPSAW